MYELTPVKHENYFTEKFIIGIVSLLVQAKIHCVMWKTNMVKNDIQGDKLDITYCHYNTQIYIHKDGCDLYGNCCFHYWRRGFATFRLADRLTSSNLFLSLSINFRANHRVTAI